MPKQWWESKTVWTNAVMSLIAVLTAMDKAIPASWMPYVLAATGIANIVLRLITDQPIQGMEA